MVITLPPIPRHIAPIGCPPVAEALPEAVRRIVESVHRKVAHSVLRYRPPHIARAYPGVK